jgi:hypothetical protein
MVSIVVLVDMIVPWLGSAEPLRCEHAASTAAQSVSETGVIFIVASPAVQWVRDRRERPERRDRGTAQWGAENTPRRGD